MKFEVSILIYIYLAIAVCIIAFNVVFVGYRKCHELHMPKRMRKWRERVRILLLSNEVLTDKDRKKLERKLKRTSQLSVFYKTAALFFNSDRKEEIRDWLQKNQKLFDELSVLYMKKPAIEKAYYAFLMKEFQLGSSKERDTIVRFMYELVVEPSVYCRENALQALYSFGRIEPVVKAYEFLNRSGVQHSSKLVTDGLLSFAGDQDGLAQALWKNWDTFSTFYRIAFLNFFRMATGSLCACVFPILNSNADREEQFAVIRYYRKHYYQQAHQVLLDYVSNSDKEEWEFAALSASSLDRYPGEETIKVLLTALSSRSWYVRNNASDSIIALAPNHPAIQTVLQKGDRYAKEMMEYKLSKYDAAGKGGKSL